MKSTPTVPVAQAIILRRMAHPGWYAQWMEANSNLRFALRHGNLPRASELADEILLLVGR